LLRFVRHNFFLYLARARVVTTAVAMIVMTEVTSLATVKFQRKSDVQLSAGLIGALRLDRDNGHVMGIAVFWCPPRKSTSRSPSTAAARTGSCTERNRSAFGEALFVPRDSVSRRTKTGELGPHSRC
jgi:hypothetical protein